MTTISLPELCLVSLVGPSGAGKSTFARRHFKPTEVLSSDFFRTCISNDHRTRYWCYFVDTKADPPKLTRDHDTRPNSLVAPAG